MQNVFYRKLFIFCSIHFLMGWLIFIANRTTRWSELIVIGDFQVWVFILNKKIAWFRLLRLIKIKIDNTVCQQVWSRCLRTHVLVYSAWLSCSRRNVLVHWVWTWFFRDKNVVVLFRSFEAVEGRNVFVLQSLIRMLKALGYCVWAGAGGKEWWL